jgi:hypothetical protein
VFEDSAPATCALGKDAMDLHEFTPIAAAESFVTIGSIGEGARSV